MSSSSVLAPPLIGGNSQEASVIHGYRKESSLPPSADGHRAGMEKSQNKHLDPPMRYHQSESQQTFGEDEEMYRLQASGALKDVVGSQSMLSQEINPEQENSPVLFDEKLTAVSAAKRYGILTQEDSSPEEEEEDTYCGIEAIKQAAVSARTVAPQEVAAKEYKGTSFAVQDTSYHPKVPQPLSQEPAQVSFTANFESLLDAVDVVSEIEKKEEEMQAAQGLSVRKSLRLATTTKKHEEYMDVPPLPNKRKSTFLAPAYPGTAQNEVPAFAAREVEQTPPPCPPKKRKTNTVKTEVTSPDENLAHEAAQLAARTIHDPDLAKELLLSMALSRESPRTAPETVPGSGYVLPDGFFWAHYPPLEYVLKENMTEYFSLSMSKCQSAQQQAFNNDLVVAVRNVADRLEWTFDPKYFTDKIIRDRIRCYYKTHIQNAKKRLKTMLKNPTKKANARHLMQHYDLIKKTFLEKKKKKEPWTEEEKRRYHL